MAVPSRFASSSLLVLLATGALLTGCGNDGSPTATPASTGDGSVQPTDGGTSGSYLYASLNVVDAANGTTGQRIALVDSSTGALLKAFNVAADSTQVAAQAFTVAADGLSTQAGGGAQLYYTDGGKIYELGLTKPAAAGNGVQVPYAGVACGLIKTIPKDASAAMNWLVVNTAGQDGDCQTAEDNLTKLVATDGSAAPAIALGAGGAQVLDVVRDAQGKLLQILAYETTTTQASVTDPGSNTTSVVTKIASLKLVAIAANGTQTDVANGNVAAVVSGGVSTIPSVSYLSKVAGKTDQIYVKVGKDIRVLSWANGAPTLASQAVATLNGDGTPFVHTDGQATYFVDTNAAGTQQLLNKLTPGTTQVLQLATLAAGEEVQQGSAMTASSLLLVLRKGDTYSLRAVRKADGAVNEVSLGTAGPGPLAVEAVNGDTAVVSQLIAQGKQALWRVSAAVTSTSAGASQPVITAAAINGAGQAHLIATVGNGTTTLAGETQHTQVVWCDATTSCSASNVKSYQVQGDTSVTVSGQAAGTSWIDTRAVPRSLTQGLFTSSSSTASNNGPVWSTDSLWWFDATKAASLNKIETTSGQ